MKDIGLRFSSAAAMLLMVSSTASLAIHRDDANKRVQSEKSEKVMLWHAHANGCGPGENPPPGTNCSN
jgi:hypothetical protein